MPRRKRRPAVAEFLDDAVETAVDTFFDRASDAFTRIKDQAVHQQRARLPPEYLASTFQCAGCKRPFSIDKMEQVHPENGWGTCKGCYSFMFTAGVAKAKEFAKRTAKAGAQRAAQAGFKPPPPPPGPKPWELLDISKDASIDEIKKAYREKAMLYHPDRVPPGSSSDAHQQARNMFESVTRAKDVMLKVRQAPE